MRIAVTSQNFKSITGHAGQSRRFLVYEADAAGNIQEQERLDLPKEMSLHSYHGLDHPVFTKNLQAVITQSAGQGFIQRLVQQGIKVHVTGETDPLAAVTKLYANQPLAAPAPRDDHSGCSCHHGQDHGHGHAVPIATLSK